ncbi:hypothetical protein QWY97_10490 [Vibrio cortegadensis]|uniref:hypothetical protein n=1 Tax=Vibrio cortegadensis TaxID=1328770 RepID=UPI0021C33DA0|nr:hypothetical protein [Vibrio cortegadensis]MDN3697773.1 hypothetical protein [Vibrio cortegadensis]
MSDLKFSPTKLFNLASKKINDYLDEALENERIKQENHPQRLEEIRIEGEFRRKQQAERHKQKIAKILRETPQVSPEDQAIYDDFVRKLEKEGKM